MDTQELLKRTMNAAKEKREQSFEQTADALDEIVVSLLELMNSPVQSVGEKSATSLPNVLHIHAQQPVPQRPS